MAKLKKTHVSHCSLHHCLQQLEHGSNLDVHRQMYIYTMEYYSAIKRNAFESVLMRWMNREVSQKGKDKYHTLPHIFGS